jgi:hypothetical protein
VGAGAPVVPAWRNRPSSQPPIIDVVCGVSTAAVAVCMETTLCGSQRHWGNVDPASLPRGPLAGGCLASWSADMTKDQGRGGHSSDRQDDLDCSMLLACQVTRL